MNKIQCPRCSKTASEQPKWVTAYYDPRFVCKQRKCGYEGQLNWNLDKGTTKERKRAA